MRHRDVRVIGPEGEQIGILQSRQALQMAKEQGLDLVLVAPNAQPPVCRILDYGRFKYETEKLNKAKKSKTQDVKGIKISPRIADHDIGVALKKATQFLSEGHKVKVVCMFRAREVTHPENGMKRLTRMAEELKEVAVVERAPSMEGRMMTMILTPKPGSKKQNAKTEDKQDGREAVQSDGIGEDHAPTDAQQPPVPPQERSAEATAGGGTDPVQGGDEAS